MNLSMSLKKRMCLEVCRGLVEGGIGESESLLMCRLGWDDGLIEEKDRIG